MCAGIYGSHVCVAHRSDARASGYAEAVVTVDNYTSKAHTVLQVPIPHSRDARAGAHAAPPAERARRIAGADA